MNNNSIEYFPTTDRSMHTRMEYHPSEFAGKAQRGSGLGGPNDHITNPMTEAVPNVMHVNGVRSDAFADMRGRLQQLADLSFKKPQQMHDRRFLELHQMDYETDPSVGFRQVDMPDMDNPNLYERFRLGTPSQRMKKDTIIPGPADSDSGYRRTKSYNPPSFISRPLMNAPSTERDIISRPATTSTMQSMGKTSNPLIRNNVREGTRRKRVLSTFEPSAGTDVVPRPETAALNVSDLSNVAHRERDDVMQSLKNMQIMRDGGSSLDYHGGGGVPNASGIDDGVMGNVLGNDYHVYATGKAKRGGGPGSLSNHANQPTLMAVRNPQWSTTRNKITNLSDAQQIWGKKDSMWGFADPVRASSTRGNSSMYRMDGRRRVEGNERNPNIPVLGINDIAGVQTTGADFRGGKDSMVNAAQQRAPHIRRSFSQQNPLLGEQSMMKKRMHMDTTVAPRNPTTHERVMLQSNPFAVKHQAFYDVRRLHGLASSAGNERTPDLPGPEISSHESGSLGFDYL